MIAAGSSLEMNRDRPANDANIMPVPKNLNAVGPQLQLLRHWREQTQTDLAKKLNYLGWKVDRTIVAQMETMQKRISDCDLIFLAKALNVTIADFFPLSLTPAVIRSKINLRRSIVRQLGSAKPIANYPHQKRKNHVRPAQQNFTGSRLRSS